MSQSSTPSPEDEAALLEKEKDIDSELNKYKNTQVDADNKLLMEKLHTYNDIKDATQIVLARLADMKGMTVTEVHKMFDLPREDDIPERNEAGKAKKTRNAMQKYAQMKKMIGARDSRVNDKKRVPSKKKKPDDPHKIEVRELPQVSSALFFQYNTQLGPPYHVLIDTNFINHSIKYKLDIIQNMMDCLYAKCIPYITDCVIGELEKLGHKYNIALKIIKDPRFERISCMHKGTYADDCLVQRVTQHKCYIVATCDRDLKRRIRKIPGVPIMYVARHRYTIERMPDAYGAPRE